MTCAFSHDQPISFACYSRYDEGGQLGAKFSTEEYLDMIHNCVEAGATSFDHADIYGHYTVEEEFGAALARDKSLRTKVQLITKCGINLVTSRRPAYQLKHYDTSINHIRESARHLQACKRPG